jgi:hypothetical protein
MVLRGRAWFAGRVGRLTAGDVACWLLKTAEHPAGLVAGWGPGGTAELRRCVRRSYRLGLVRAGDPCLLWRSGRDRPGVWAAGTVVGAPAGRGDGPVVTVRLALLAEPVPRAELLADPRFRDAEVVRMAAGSNPSWLSAAQHAAVLDRLPDPPSPAAVAPWPVTGSSPGTMGTWVATGSGGERSAGS